MNYPHGPGWKGGETSRQAAEDVANKAAAIRFIVEQDVRLNGKGNPETIAERTGLDLHSVRSRCSELATDGIFEDSGERWTNENNKRTKVWQIATRGPKVQGALF